MTLGIPRLREILMTAAASIKTPVMTLPLHAGLGAPAAADLAVRLKRIRLAEALRCERCGLGWAGRGGAGWGCLCVPTTAPFHEQQHHHRIVWMPGGGLHAQRQQPVFGAAPGRSHPPRFPLPWLLLAPH